jgi:hypothetical protein
MGHKQIRPTIFLVGCILIILLGAVATIFWQARSELPARADSGNVIGSPTLPAATVDTILANMGSPMAGTGAVIEQASRQTNIDDAFALAVWWTETNDGAAGVGFADRNPGSVRGSYGYPAAFDGYTVYPSYAAGITDWFNVLRSRYVDSGLTSAYTICYPYVGTSSSYQWAIKVVNLMAQYHAIAPPPPTPTPTPIPTPDAVRIQHVQVHVVKSQPAPLGLTREAHVTGNVVPPVIVLPRTSVNVPAHSSVAQLSPASPIIIFAGLLAALLIALWGMRIGRSAQCTVANPLPVPVASEEPVPAFAALAQMPLPALYVNEFSPVLIASPQTEQLPWSSSPAPVVQPDAVPVFAGMPEGGGLLKRYADTDALPRRIRLRPISIVSEPVQQSVGQGNWYGSVPETPIAFTAPGESVREEKVPEVVGVGARPLGLLRRYAMEKSDGSE